MSDHALMAGHPRAYEPRFGTVESPIKVPSLMDERIMGVTDPEDDTLVIWGIIRANEPPKQLVAGGEFFVLEKVGGWGLWIVQCASDQTSQSSRLGSAAACLRVSAAGTAVLTALGPHSA